MEPLALRLNPGRDFPEDLSAHLAQVIVPAVTLSDLWIHICFHLQEIYCCAGWLLLHLVRDGSSWEDLQGHNLGVSLSCT